jgi:hypothetical protein
MMKRVLVALVAVAFVASALGAAPAANAPAGAAKGQTFAVTVSPGSQWGTTSTLYDLFPADYDIVQLSAPSPTPVTVVVEDCCIMGDTMAAGRPGKAFFATSPDVISVSFGPFQGSLGFACAYIDCPGGFPAGYYLYIYGS